MVNSAAPTFSLQSLAIWSALLLLFITPYFGLEVTLTLCFVVLLFQNYSHLYFSTSFLLLFSCLLFILIIGFFGAFFHSYRFYDSLKDFAYTLRPILMLFIGYVLITGNLQYKDYILSNFMNVIYFIALGHVIWSLGILLSTQGNYFYEVRTSFFGLGNHLETLAFGLTLIRNKDSILYTKVKHTYWKQFILIFSIFLYFSRVDLILLIFTFLCMHGWFTFNLKFMFRFIFFLLLSFGIVLILMNIETNDQHTGVMELIHKFKNSVTEIISYDIKREDHADLWKKWRAYEAKQAIEQVFDKGPLTWIFGNGFGSLVDLEMKVDLRGFETRYIPVLHNGLAQVFFKTGFFGLLAILIFNLALFIPFRRRTDEILNDFKINLGFQFFITILVIGGIFGGYSELSIVIGMVYALNQKYENWNHRDTGNT